MILCTWLLYFVFFYFLFHILCIFVHISHIIFPTRSNYDSARGFCILYFCCIFVFLISHSFYFYISHIIFPTRSNYDSLHASARRHISFFLFVWRGCALITRQTFTLSNDDHDHIDDHILVIIFGDHNIGDQISFRYVTFITR